MGKLKQTVIDKTPRLYTVVVGGMLAILLLLFSVRVNIKETIIAASVLVVGVSLLHKLKIGHNLASIKRIPLFLFLAAFITRYSYCCIFGPITQQTSDFAVTLWEAECGSFVDMVGYYRVYLHKFFYPFLLHTLGFRTQDAIFFLQCIFTAFVPVVIYYIWEKITPNSRIGCIAAVVYIIWPGQLFYATVITEEHLAALVTVLIVFFLLDLVQTIEQEEQLSRNRKKILAKFVIVGSLCGVSAFLKDWALIILVAIIPCVLYLLVIYKKQQRIILFVGIILILLARSAVQTGGAMLAERKLGVKANNQIIASEMYVSLDPNGNGLWDPERLGEYQQMVQAHDYDFDAANREAMQEIVRRIKENLDKMPSFLLYKGTHAYGDDEELLAWPLDYSMNPDYHQYFIANIYLWKSISKLFYAFVVACLCISAVTLRNRYIFFIELISVGAILSGLLIECQGRYKYSIEPLWCLLVANAIYILMHIKSRKEIRSPELQTG